MIINFFSRFQKQAAALLFYILVLQTLAPAYGYDIIMDPPFYVKGDIKNKTVSGISGLDKYKKDDALHALSMQNQIKNDEVQKEKKPGKKYKKPLPQNDIDGPGQPEMSGFKPASVDNMVNLFSGDFSYNIPLLDVDGYPINIYYNAGNSMEQEASWVGLGWNINPGTISRNMRGLPDDFKGDEDAVTKIQSVKKDITVGINVDRNYEVAGLPSYLSLSGKERLGLSYNNKTGFGMDIGASGEFNAQKRIFKTVKTEKTSFDYGSIGLYGNLTLSSKTGTQLDGGINFRLQHEYLKENSKQTVSQDANSAKGKADITPGKEMQLSKKTLEYQLPINFARSSFTPGIRMPTTTANILIGFKGGESKKILFSNLYFSGTYTEQFIALKDQVQKKAAYGFLYYQDANNNTDALLDFNRINDGVVNKNTNVISLPHYTYDIFTISGEGTGGSFRAYRGTPGYSRDPKMKTRSGNVSIDLDFGAGNGFHLGAKPSGAAYSFSEIGNWETDNLLEKKIGFNENNGTYQGVYFKNPQEMAIIDADYYSALGEDNLIRPYFINKSNADPRLAASYQKITNNQVTKTVLPNLPFIRNKRDKKTQVISYLTASEASKIGLNKNCYSFTENVFLPLNCTNAGYKTTIPRTSEGSYRKKHHISEIDVTEGDGKRYIYGLPAYNITQRDVSFSVENNGNNSTGNLITYDPGDNSQGNKKGRDNFFQKEIIGAFPHSFLLTQILSPDYVDVKDDGISDDDLGTAISFNYTRINAMDPQKASTKDALGMKWRAPTSHSMNQANYMENLKADPKDDKASYSYGEKEVWYLHSLVSKNMVATFTLAARKDLRPAAGENGNIDYNGPGQRRLDKIDLYTKADFIKDPAKAKPIKTVHFGYSYKLCGNNPSNNEEPEMVIRNGASVDLNEFKGKLTLDSIWFSYNGNPKQSINKYRFKYSAHNPNYNPAANDRWGTYKPQSDNPGNMTNPEFPYTFQEKTKSDYNAKAWNLENILMPSGSQIDITYEADDYAYVQDRAASIMTKVAGFGISATATPQNLLYTLFSSFPLQQKDNMYMFVDVTKAVTLNNPSLAQKEIAAYYLKDLKQLLFKLHVKVKDDMYEPITMYSNIESYGVVANNAFRIWIKLELTEKDKNPIYETLTQYIKDYLPKVAYPSSDVRDESAPKQVMLALYGMIQRFYSDIVGFENASKAANKFREILDAKCFVRLNEPNGMKFGGGYRVKKITIKDNWKAMAGDPLASNDGYVNAEYGQEYIYSRKEMLNGVERTISSGVATYEPATGNEENPFKEIIKTYTKQNLNPWILGNDELPIAETFFPSPGIGYSKVVVRSIHNKNYKKIKSGIGFQQSDFYTAKDFPVIAEYSSFDEESNRYYKTTAFRKMIFNRSKENNTRTQGFRIVLNDMHGKQKYQASYSETDDKTPINSTEYFYKKHSTGNGKYALDNIVKVVDGPDGKISEKIIGKDIEVTNDFAQHFSKAMHVQRPGNLDMFTLLSVPIVLLNIFKSTSINTSRYRAATTLKVVNDFGILDSVVNNDKGSIVSTENLLYDAETGQVLVSKTKNEFKKPIYQVNYPAHWLKNEMAHAYTNIDAVYKNVVFKNGKLVSGVANMNDFISGDEIYVQSTYAPLVEEIPCQLVGYPNLLPVNYEYKIWALDIRKDETNINKEFIFLDRYGNPYNGNVAYMRIIRSGNRNILGASVGSVVCLENPLEVINNQEKLVINDSKKIINASAAEFREKWRTENMFYAKDTIITQSVYAPIRKIGILPKKVLGTSNIYENYILRYHQYNTFWGWKDADNILPSLLNNKSIDFMHMHEKNRRRTQVASWVPYDISTLPVEAKIIKATLNITPHNYRERPIENIDFQHHYENITDIEHLRNQGAQYHGFYSNSGIVDRPLMDWQFLTSSNNTKTAFDIYNNKHTNGVGIPATAFGYSNMAFLDRVNNSIDVTYLFENMIADNRNPAKNYASALRFRYYTGIYTNSQRNSEKQFQCYDNKTTGIYVKYYLLSEALPPGTTPANPESYIFLNNVLSKTTLCLSEFDKKQINPYVTGILGNWRGWRSYVFNGARRQKDPDIKTNIVNDGAIEGFENFWELGGAVLVKATTTKWQWNSEITQYNRKGIEVENRDPLSRYNAGLYGYQQSLPIAVANNSKYKEIAFDGFEDYYYNADPCLPFCDPNSKHFEPGVNISMLNNQNAHTGKYSVRVNTNTNHTVNLPVVLHNQNYIPNLKISMLNLQSNVPVVTPKGIGLKRYYYNNNNFIGGGTVTIPSPVNLYTSQSNQSVKWKGSIQATRSGSHIFHTYTNGNVNDFGRVYINGTLVSQCSWGGGYTVQQPYTMVAGTLYDIEVHFINYNSSGFINLAWQTPDDFNHILPVPNLNLYPEGQSALADSTVQIAGICRKPDEIKPTSNVFIDKFSLTPGQKMVAGIWVKVGEAQHVFTTYANGISIQIKNGNSILESFTAKEAIIEGWQLFEAVFTVPSGTANLSLVVQNNADKTLFFDDLRLHPFNANMKSFVYDPVNLRLSSELDENNYASFYEYDEDGTLIRVKKETRLGIKTITETRSSLQKEIKTIQ